MLDHLSTKRQPRCEPNSSWRPLLSRTMVVSSQSMIPALISPLNRYSQASLSLYADQELYQARWCHQGILLPFGSWWDQRLTRSIPFSRTMAIMGGVGRANVTYYRRAYLFFERLRLRLREGTPKTTKARLHTNECEYYPVGFSITPTRMHRCWVVRYRHCM
jgi:hypothetical protein